MLAGAACVGIAIRAFAGKPWVERQAERIDGLNVIVLFLFAVALMGDVLANAIAHPLFVLGLLALSTAVTFGLSGLTALIFARAGMRHALPLAHAAGSRNTGLMLAAAAGAVPELVWLYVALIQIPIYALPLIVKPLVRRLDARSNDGERHQTLRLDEVDDSDAALCRLISCFSRLAKFGAAGRRHA